MNSFAYDLSYLPDFQDTFGCMFQYVENDLDIQMNTFYGMFLKSDIAREIEHGNPKYIAGMSGIEIARSVILEKTRIYTDGEPSVHFERNVWYWIGFVLSYYQCMRNVGFKTINDLGLTIDKIFSMYILHEADITKFIDAADSITNLNKGKGRVLSYYRKLNGVSQKELAERTGVPIRMIQLYEQNQNNVSKANSEYVYRIAKGLGIEMELLISK